MFICHFYDNSNSIFFSFSFCVYVVWYIPRSKGGPMSQVPPINLVLFGGHSDYLRICTDLHQSKVKLRTFPKQSNKKPSPQTWKVRKLAKSWNHLEVRTCLKMKPNRTAEYRNLENSLLIISFEHLDLAIPEDDIFNCQPINSLFIWSQFSWISIADTGRVLINGLEKVGKRLEHLRPATYSFQTVHGKRT